MFRAYGDYVQHNFVRFSSSACHQVPPPCDSSTDKRRPQAGSRTVLECPRVLGARIIIPKTILKKSKFLCFKNRKFSDFCPPPTAASSENSRVCQAKMCFDGWVSDGARSYKLQGLSIGPMSSFPVIYSNRFGVKTLHPTRYRPPAMSSAHPEKRTTMVGGPLGKATYGRDNCWPGRGG